MDKTQEEWDAISDHLAHSLQQIRIGLGLCQHNYKLIKEFKINRLGLSGENLPEDLERYLSSPTHIMIYECRICKKIKEQHFIKVPQV